MIYKILQSRKFEHDHDGFEDYFILYLPFLVYLCKVLSVRLNLIEQFRPTLTAN